MRKCFVLGAGFSKAVAGLPVMREMAKEFWKVHDDPKNAGNERLRKQGTDLRALFKCYKEQDFARWVIEDPLLEKVLKDKNPDWDYEVNLEAILSLIDLHSFAPSVGRIKVGELPLKTQTPGFLGYAPNLHPIRSCIEEYFYHVLINPPALRPELLDAFAQGLQRGDDVITFNYDLVLEQALYRHGGWFPHDGYGVSFPNIPSVRVAEDVESEVVLLKLHGSLNWRASRFASLFDDDRLGWWHDDGRPFFPGYLQDETAPWPQYEGLHSRFGMLPSFVKLFESQLLLDVWRTATAALAAADKVVVIGYSLPSQDAAAALLFATAGLDKKPLLVVDPNAGEVAEHFTQVTGHPGPEKYSSLEDYLQCQT